MPLKRSITTYFRWITRRTSGPIGSSIGHSDFSPHAATRRERLLRISLTPLQEQDESIRQEVHEFFAVTAIPRTCSLLTGLHLTAYYFNVFKYGDSCHPGLLGLATRLFRRIGRATNFETIITHSGIEVYSNYFVARPRFWRAWLEVTEQLFEIAESQDDPLGMELRRPTQYRGGESVEIKVFLMERVATWLLAREPQFVVKARDPFIARSRLYKLPGAIVCDAVKIAYQQNGRSREFADLFRIVSRFARGLSLLIRLGSFWRIEPARRCVAALATYWKRPERPA